MVDNFVDHVGSGRNGLWDRTQKYRRIAVVPPKLERRQAFTGGNFKTKTGGFRKLSE